ncbi:SDR family oxidoreductase [Pseudoteredinibacter isoporae]|uniref:NAD(P)-dependent dehydrogenase (Short-subunit alcohol dehydrogenase family) n=1 Tax=Pseudoteredinibacter isoporae TaxID=570281 RepID=A0A7X0JV73_9GAMM|nr:SDR family oxidoreductase [Pseudoteredinibacter isoporae]MBB6522882.1 NAD(P)-dependent dehydrogenase (short-subunit alcohol dehydrogenase family) [Pseudoteredinibacter isoporae]NHO88408.1 SDR family oxidoreductase [Pseudoteredinibacter isoporae]NIB23261.1 SDR family oxidoreductase [Pseudoteredinibacter isoporae]
MDKLVLITGAGRGIGAATAKHLAGQGYRVIINYRRDIHSAETLRDNILAGGGQAYIAQADIADQTQVKDLFEIIDQEHGQLSHLVNNAGILFKQCGFGDIDADRFKTILNTNVLGSFYCLQEAIKRMASGAAIVNVSSLAAITGSPFEYIDYAASKGALDSMTVGLAKELAGKNIRVNGVRPGLIYTEMHADGGEPGRVDRLADQIPLQRGGEPEEVAQAIAWLLSEEASFVTGSFIDVAGGK